MSASERIEAIVRLCHAHPDDTKVRVRINNGDWLLIDGNEFLELWTQPFAGTIDVDSAYRLGSQDGS